jgi:hypothetical protein
MTLKHTECKKKCCNNNSVIWSIFFMQISHLYFRKLFYCFLAQCNFNWFPLCRSRSRDFVFFPYPLNPSFSIAFKRNLSKLIIFNSKVC